METIEEITKRQNLEAEQKRGEAAMQRSKDFMESFESPSGKRVYTYLSRFCLENRTAYVEGSPHKTSFNEGARSVILEIRRWLDMDLTKLSKESEL